MMDGFEQKHSLLYAAMDVFPSAKGASTHIQYFAQALQDWAGDLGLITLGDEKMPFHQQENQLEILRFQWLFSNYLERAMAWSSFVELIGLSQEPTYIQFRDPWSGMAFQNQKCHKIFEINALPSIELPMIYPLMPQSTREKMIQIEKYCIENASILLTPSQIIAQYLIKNGVHENKIQVIPNGFDPNIENGTIEPIEDPYLIYFGALQPWQGVDILLRAFARVRIKNLKLLICASNRKQNAKILQKLATKLGIEDRVIWEFELKKPDLKNRIQGALASVAPLTKSARNTMQGCNPLKILESAGFGTAIIASDLPVVKEILTEDMFFSFPADQSSTLARCIELVYSEPEIRKEKSEKAEQHILNYLTWKHSTDKLIEVYEGLK